MPSPVDTPVLIVGAGISGLILAQVFRKERIPFRIVERKENAEAGGAGWGFTINWSLSLLLEMLPPQLQDRFSDTYVDQEAVKRGELATFPFFDLLSGEMKYEVPSSKRVRVNRDKLRKLLLSEIDVEESGTLSTWSKSVQSVEVTSENAVATFEGGEKCSAYLLVGCDGTHSRVRRAVFPNCWTNKPIPANMLGMTISLPESAVAEIRKLDAFFLHGTDKTKEIYFWFSLLDVPTNHIDSSVDTCRCQILISWPSSIPGPASNSERLQFLRDLSNDWVDPFRSLIHLLPETAELKKVVLDDWIRPEDNRTSLGAGTVVLMGDAGHTMTMYRGEGANHAITDVHDFTTIVVPVIQKALHSKIPSQGDVEEIKIVAKSYEERMFSRSWIAVLASGQATLDAHIWDRITAQSPLVAKRQMFLHDVFDIERGILA